MKKILLLTIILVLLHINTYANEINIIDNPILWTDYRIELTREYSLLHYGVDKTQITPQAVVVHWTASDTYDSVYYTFYHEERNDGTLNVASHFVVDRDGTIYRLTPETALNRHAIGYNWCSIGIENVGGVDGIEDLTNEQLEANVQLIRYLHKRYPTIEYVFGHYQQDTAHETGLYIENVDGYYSGKTDPGPIFMNGLKENLKDTPLKFLDI